MVRVGAVVLATLATVVLVGGVEVVVVVGVVVVVDVGAAVVEVDDPPPPPPSPASVVVVVGDLATCSATWPIFDFAESRMNDRPADAGTTNTATSRAYSTRVAARSVRRKRPGRRESSSARERTMGP